MNFTSFPFSPQIMNGILKAGYKTATPIQEKTIPVILSGKDVLGLAQTGTGKTAAFALPILQKLTTGQKGVIRALIISPTRELADQTNANIKILGKQTGLKSCAIYGGVSQHGQVRELHAGVDIVVACPGRLLDLKAQGVLDLSKVEIVVLDEADHMFDMGFLPSIRRILQLLPAKRQSLLFSATMPDEIRELATKILYQPVTIEIEITAPINTITHQLLLLDGDNKLNTLLDLLSDTGDGQVLVFTRTKHRAKKLAIQLTKAGHGTTSLQGNLSQNQRQSAMNAFRKGDARILVATDIAARGIDVSQVSHVINFDMPSTVDAYTHRSGRTGRMERLGTAITFVTNEDLGMLRAIEKVFGKTIQTKTLPGYTMPEKTATDLPAKKPNLAPARRTFVKTATNRRSERSNDYTARPQKSNKPTNKPVR